MVGQIRGALAEIRSGWPRLVLENVVGAAVSAALAVVAAGIANLSDAERVFVGTCLFGAWLLWSLRSRLIAGDKARRVKELDELASKAKDLEERGRRLKTLYENMPPGGSPEQLAEYASTVGAWTERIEEDIRSTSGPGRKISPKTVGRVSWSEVWDLLHSRRAEIADFLDEVERERARLLGIEHQPTVLAS